MCHRSKYFLATCQALPGIFFANKEGVIHKAEGISESKGVKALLNKAYAAEFESWLFIEC